MIKLNKTERGFGLLEFKDRYREDCSMQDSSLATDRAIWLGITEPKVQICIEGEGWKDVDLPKDALVSSRMHLTQKQVQELLPYLVEFAKTGDSVVEIFKRFNEK